MAVLLYARADAPDGIRLKQLLETHLSGIEVETYGTLEDFFQRFTQPLQDPLIAIFLFANAKDLVETLPIRHQFQDASLILILPDREPGTIALAHQLRPRFLTDLQNDLAAVPAVVERMLRIRTGQPPP
jgi:hypothetical protein